MYGVCEYPFAVITEFCEKGSLEDMLYGERKVEFSVSHLNKIILGIAKGLNHLHKEGVVHR